MGLHALHDGRLVEIRSIHPDDGPRLRDYHRRLSPESQYQRFLGVKPELSAADTRYLVEIDGRSHFALVATDPDTEEMLGVARFVRLPDDRQAAEFAVVVADDYQQQGLATELIDQLALAAAQRGFRRFRAAMLADNVAIRRLMQRLAAGPVRILERGTVIVLEVELAVALSPA